MRNFTSSRNLSRWVVIAVLFSRKLPHKDCRGAPRWSQCRYVKRNRHSCSNSSDTCAGPSGQAANTRDWAEDARNRSHACLSGLSPRAGRARQAQKRLRANAPPSQMQGKMLHQRRPSRGPYRKCRDVQAQPCLIGRRLLCGQPWRRTLLHLAVRGADQLGQIPLANAEVQPPAGRCPGAG